MTATIGKLPFTRAYLKPLYLLLLLGYAIGYSSQIPNAELTTDDGTWLLMARAHVTTLQPFILNLPSSIGTRNGALGAYLHEFFYFIHPSISSILIGIILLNLIVHYQLFKIGELLKNPLIGIMGSLFYFVSPEFFCITSLKSSQIAYLPLFSVLTFRLLLGYVCQGIGWYFFAAAVSLFCGMQLHGSSILLAPLLLWVAATTRFKLPERQMLVAGFLTSLLVSVAAVIFKPDLALFLPIRTILDLLPGMSNYIASHVGMSPPAWSWNDAVSLSTMALLAFGVLGLVHYASRDRSQKLLLAWVLIPIAGLNFMPLVFASYPHQWVLFLFPVLFVAIAQGVEDVSKLFGTKRAGLIRNVAFALLVVTSAAFSVTYSSFIAASGGTGGHLASLSTKQQVVAEIFKRDANPKVVLALDRRIPGASYGIGGWCAALVFGRPPEMLVRGASATFVVYEEGSLGSIVDFPNQVARLGLVEIARVKQVIVFQSLEGTLDIGVVLPVRNPYAP